MTNADRLHRIIATVSPEVAAAHAKTGAWPPKPDGCPYQIETLKGGTRRVTVSTPDGDRMGATGATVAEAIGRLEQKLGISA